MITIRVPRNQRTYERQEKVIKQPCTKYFKCEFPMKENKCGKFPEKESEVNPMPGTPKLITDLCDADKCETDELYSWGRELLRVVDFLESEV